MGKLLAESSDITFQADIPTGEPGSPLSFPIMTSMENESRGFLNSALAFNFPREQPGLHIVSPAAGIHRLNYARFNNDGCQFSLLSAKAKDSQGLHLEFDGLVFYPDPTTYNIYRLFGRAGRIARSMAYLPPDCSEPQLATIHNTFRDRLLK